ncbi:MAG: hypothetical protein AB7F86_18270 [Bdellovibrionales bacterium]
MIRLLIIFSFLVTVPAHALIELKAHYGKWTGEPKDFNTRIESTFVNHPNFSGPDIIGGDLLLTPMMMTWVFGVRYESFDMKESGDITVSGLTISSDASVKGHRTSALLGKRFVSLPVGYIGILFHYGLENKADYNLNLGGVDNKYNGVVDTSYGGGIESAFKLGPLLMGAEIGYTCFKVKKWNDSSKNPISDSSGEIPFDLTGMYYHVTLGVSL